MRTNPRKIAGLRRLDNTVQINTKGDFHTLLLRRATARWLAVLIVLIGACLRMPALDESPPGLLPDEASNSYDAYSIWHTGRDQHGVLFPTILRAFNDYRGAVFIYSQAPLVGMGGLTVANARLASAFWGVVAVAATYWVGRLLFDRLTGLVAAFLLAVSPWYVPLSRLAHEGTTTVLTSLLLVGLFWRWQRAPQTRKLVATACVAGLGLYTYSVMKMFLPLMVVALALIFWRKVYAHWRQVIVAAIVGVLVAAPMFYKTLYFPEKMQARYAQITILQPGESPVMVLSEALHNVWDNVSPDFLFARGDLDETHHPSGLGQLYPVQALFLVAAIVLGGRQHTLRLPLIVTWLWVILGTLPTAFIVMPPGWGQSLRALPAVVPWQLLSAVGIVATLRVFRRSWMRLFAIGTALLWIAVNALGYFGYYFMRYPDEAPERFDLTRPTLIRTMDALDDAYSTVYFTCNAAYYAYIEVLFFTQYDPVVLQNALPIWQAEGLFAPVLRVGKYQFVCDIADVWDTGVPGLYVALYDELPGVEPLLTIHDADDQTAYTIAGRLFFPYPIETLDWLNQCNRPAEPIPSDLIVQGTGGVQLRNINFDCTTSWFYPAGNATAGVYVLHHDLLVNEENTLKIKDSFVRRHINVESPVWNNTMFTEQFPGFAIYKSTPYSLPSDSKPIIARAAEQSISGGIALSLPVRLDGPLTFLGTWIYSDNAALEVETWWRVTRGPIERNFSIMAHLLNTEGEIISVADGLGVSPVTLLEGDVIIQRHLFPLPVGGTYQIRTGGYWLDDNQRWSLEAQPGIDALYIPLVIPEK